MAIKALTRVVDACARHPWPVIGAMFAVGIVAGIHAGLDFSVDTDTRRLLPDTLPWRHVLADYHKEFPAHPILAVIDAPSPEMTAASVASLAAGLEAIAGKSGPVRSAEPLGRGPYFDRAALLFAPLERTRALAARLEAAAPLLAAAARTPDLLGVAAIARAEAEGATRAPQGAAQTTRLLDGLADTIADARAGRPAWFSWQSAMADRNGPSVLRGFIGVEPVLDYRALQPGLAATDRVRSVARELDIAGRDGARLRLTGEVPINDEQFSTLQSGQTLGLLGTTAAVLAILWLALRSFRIILAVAVSLGVGFAITCSAGLLLVGSFNVLSIAFAVLFVGLGADFGIQFCVRYRAERFEVSPDPAAQDEGTALRSALHRTAEKAGVPLALAAAGTTVGFFSFLPTDYKGVSELGLIAGVGMLVAFTTTMTLLPALLAVLRPPGEAHRMGFSAFAPGDRFLSRHRHAVVFWTLGVVLAGTPLLGHLKFDFDPTHLQVATAPAVETYRDLAADPESGVDAIDATAPDLAAADRLAVRLSGLSEVGAVHTASGLVPPDQTAKRAILAQLRAAIGPALATPTAAASSDRAVVDALQAAGKDLARTASAQLRGDVARGDVALRHATTRLAAEMTALAAGAPAARARAALAIARPLAIDLDLLRTAIGEPRAGMAGPRGPGGIITVADLPPALKRDWIAPDGRARLQIVPTGDPRDNAVLQRFAIAVTRNAVTATGGPVSLVRSQETVVNAFMIAGISAVFAIAVVLFIALRRVGDVLLTLLPLLVAGLVTLEISVLIGVQLNFANIIALPLLLGVGVAFKIYYVMAWRHGATNLLQSTLTRAVVFSAATSATAFGSLWLSPEPGLSSMGKLMALALFSTMTAAILFQPALMGPPRTGSHKT